MVIDEKSLEFWKGRRVCVTGGGGFLGSFVTEKLNQRNADTVFVVRKKDYNLIHKNDITRLLEDVQPDIILHLAASAGGIGANLLHQAEYFYENLMMGTQLIHESWKFGIEKFVSIGTVCSYPKFTPVPFQESDLWNGYPEETNAPFGLAKKMMLVQSQVYRSQYDFNAIHLLPVNLFGPRDNFDLEKSHVVPALIRKCIEAKEQGKDYVEVWGDGSASREFLYVEDAADGIILAAERYNGDLPINLGSGNETDIKDLVLTIKELTEFEGGIHWDTTRPNGQPRRSLDTQRSKELFGFEAPTSLADGLNRTIDWYLKNRQ
ncbi:MAG: GDP-L-fucose synthase [Cellvibrionaceae bacterium]|jgi:GDP-L-fucose synthase